MVKRIILRNFVHLYPEVCMIHSPQQNTLQSYVKNNIIKILRILYRIPKWQEKQIFAEKFYEKASNKIYTKIHKEKKCKTNRSYTGLSKSYCYQ